YRRVAPVACSPMTCSGWFELVRNAGLQARDETVPSPLSHLHRLPKLRRDNFGLWLEGPQGFGEGQRLCFFAVDDSNLFDVTRDRLDVAAKFIFVSMAGKGVRSEEH